MSYRDDSEETDCLDLGYETEEDPRTTDESSSDSDSDIPLPTARDRLILRSIKAEVDALCKLWSRLPNEIKSMILRNLRLGDLVEIARGAPHLAHETLRLRVKVVVARAHLKIGSVIDMLRYTGSVISGSSALIVVLPCSFINRGLDIFCAYDQVWEVFGFLQRNRYGPPRKGAIVSMSHLDHCGRDPNFNSSFVTPSSIHAIYHLTHEKTGYVVSVVRSRSVAIAPVLGYHSTILMNWIAWDGVHCMYPMLTSMYKGMTTALSFNLVIADRVRSAVSLYRDRGFTLYERCSQVKYHAA
ncbi:hypothetical protein BKA70DRAFT_1440998 [Coprinopsis sp. MPI-PUGE-AT-0042]|nr:hypothetical protein BKA70DRAFT_1440998 [Coprinopsis sp. MPI-PUGE-AT-0042]